MSVTVMIYDAESARDRIPAAREIFAAVFAEPPYLEGPEDVATWLDDLAEHLTCTGFQLVLASVDGQPVGFAYGYRITPDTWRWQNFVAPFAAAMPEEGVRSGRIFVLMEFAVLAGWRGRGVGRALHDRLLAQSSERLAHLTVHAAAKIAQAAYRSWGWVTVGHRDKAGGPGYDVMVLDRAAKPSEIPHG
jgi:GNAT superfamily N-acetyltransferase